MKKRIISILILLIINVEVYSQTRLFKDSIPFEKKHKITNKIDSAFASFEHYGGTKYQDVFKDSVGRRLIDSIVELRTVLLKNNNYKYVNRYDTIYVEPIELKEIDSNILFMLKWHITQTERNDKNSFKSKLFYDIIIYPAISENMGVSKKIIDSLYEVNYFPLDSPFNPDYKVTIVSHSLVNDLLQIKDSKFYFSYMGRDVFIETPYLKDVTMMNNDKNKVKFFCLIVDKEDADTETTDLFFQRKTLFYYFYDGIKLITSIKGMEGKPYNSVRKFSGSTGKY